MIATLGVARLIGPRVIAVLYVTAIIVTAALHGMAIEPAIDLFAYFLAGTLLYVRRSQIPLSWLVSTIGLALWVASFGSPLTSVVGAIALPYATMVVAYRSPAAWRRLCHAGDVSYGVYIYAFPVQQTILWAWPSAPPLANIAIAAPIAWTLGWASWRLVEAPALRLKPSSRTSSRTAVATSDLQLAPSASGTGTQ
jgi:peptidoglycan/LPS O-acetylase OafA/YrhL